MPTLPKITPFEDPQLKIPLKFATDKGLPRTINGGSHLHSKNRKQAFCCRDAMAKCFSWSLSEKMWPLGLDGELVAEAFLRRFVKVQ